MSLEKKIKDLSTHSKKNLNTAKATKVAIKKIEIMADQVATIASITLLLLALLVPLVCPKIPRN